MSILLTFSSILIIIMLGLLYALFRKLRQALRIIEAHEAIMEFRIEERTKELMKLANYDIITELPNRNLFKELLEQIITKAKNEKNQAFLIILQLLDFHEITTALGHQTSNLFLKEIGKYLTENLPKQTEIAHITSTQFAIARNGIVHTSQVSDIGRWILDLFSKPLKIAGFNILTSINLGIAIAPHDGTNAETLITNANLALNKAKSNIANSFQFYEASMNQYAEQRRSLLVDLHYALERNELMIHYQPQVDLKTQKLVGAESLLRWKHKEKGLLTPNQFIHFAEESGLMIPIGEWLITSVCEQMVKWQNMNLPPISLALNLSPIQFHHKGNVEMISRIIKNTKVNPKFLELEITESTIMDDIKDAIMTMKAIQALGISLALDDFGTGYSSLSYINQFPVQKIKIDQSFVQEIREGHKENLLVDIVILLGKNLNLQILAEGLETKMQMNYLRDKGCQIGQGYLFGKPIPADEFQEFFYQFPV